MKNEEIQLQLDLGCQKIVCNKKEIRTFSFKIMSKWENQLVGESHLQLYAEAEKMKVSKSIHVAAS